MKNQLIFCPIGGSGEIGMNMNLFAYGEPDNQKWIIVDIGVTFADDSIPGVDLIYPDPGFIVDKKNDLLHMNPGACGLQGFHKKRTMLKFNIENKKITNLNVIELGGK